MAYPNIIVGISKYFSQYMYSIYATYTWHIISIMAPSHAKHKNDLFSMQDILYGVYTLSMPVLSLTYTYDIHVYTFDILNIYIVYDKHIH